MVKIQSVELTKYLIWLLLSFSILFCLLILAASAFCAAIPSIMAYMILNHTDDRQQEIRNDSNDYV